VSELLTSKMFAECLNTVFELQSSSGNLPLKLIEVMDLNHSPRLEQFSLIFSGPMTPVLPQRIHALRHEKLGELNLFLVPVGPDEQGMRYEVIFNRMRRDPAKS